MRELTGKRHNEKEVKRIIAEPTPVLRGWGTDSRTENAGWKLNKMDRFVVESLRCRRYQPGKQRPDKRTPCTAIRSAGGDCASGWEPWKIRRRPRTADHS